MLYKHQTNQPKKQATHLLEAWTKRKIRSSIIEGNSIIDDGYKTYNKYNACTLIYFSVNTVGGVVLDIEFARQN